MGLWYLLRIVSQRSLMSCRLEFEDRRLDRASLFPLFDDEGRTRMVLITAEENGRIMLADWAPGLFVRDWALRNRLRLRFTDLNDASMWDEGTLRGSVALRSPVGARRRAVPGPRGRARTCGARTSPATIRQFPGSASTRAWDVRRTW